MPRRFQENSRFAGNVLIIVICAFAVVVSLEAAEKANLIANLTESLLRLAVWGTCSLMLGLSAWRSYASPDVTRAATMCAILITLRVALEVSLDIHRLDGVPLIGRHGVMTGVFSKLLMSSAISGIVYLWYVSVKTFERSENSLRALVQATSAVTGEQFFQRLAESLATMLSVRYVFVCEAIPESPGVVRTLAAWSGDRIVDNVEYEVASSPCQSMGQGRIEWHASHLQKLFPDVESLRELAAESYCGIPLVDSQGQVIGHIVIMDDSPMRANPSDAAAVRLAATRASAEIERKRALDAVEKNFGILQAVMEGTTDIVYLQDIDGTYRLINQAGANYFGMSAVDIIGKTDHSLFGEVVANQLRAENEHVQRTGTSVVQEQNVIVGGTRRIFQTNKAPYRNGDQEIVGVIGICRDITEIRLAEEQLTRLRAEIAHVTRMSTMGEMASGLAHEINQPLTAIATYADVMAKALQDANDEQVPIPMLHRLTSQIIEQAVRAGEIIRRLRGLVQKATPVRSEVNIDTLVQEVVAMLQNDLRLGRIQLETSLRCTDEAVRADGIQLQQVVLNLLRNSIDSFSGQPADSRHVRIDTYADDRHIHVEISDNGSGIPFNNRDRVFDAFATSKSSGLGMGLAISRSIVEAHRGKMWTDDHIKSGAKFHFHIPRESPDA